MKVHVRDGAACKTVKTLDIPGQKPIVIKVSTSDGTFFANVGFRPFREETLRALEEKINAAIEEFKRPSVDTWEPLIVIYFGHVRYPHYAERFQIRRFFVLRDANGKIEWFCTFAQHPVDHPGLPDLEKAERTRGTFEAPNITVIPYTPINWDLLNRAINAMAFMQSIIVKTVNEAAQDGSLVQRTESVLEDAARAALISLKSPIPEEVANGQ